MGFRRFSVEAQKALMDRLRQELQSWPEVIFAYLHGSFAVGGPFQDLDVAVFLDREKVSPEEDLQYQLRLGVRLDLCCGVPVDLQVLNEAPLAFRYHVIRGILLFTRDPDRLDEFRIRTWDDYLDYQPLARRYLREVLSE